MGKQWPQNPTLDAAGCARMCNERNGCTSFEFNKAGNENYKCGTYTGGSSNIQSSLQSDQWLSCAKQEAEVMTFAGHGCCRFDGWKSQSRSMGMQTEAWCKEFCRKHPPCFAADVARPSNGKYDCFIFHGLFAQNFRTECGTTNQEERCFKKEKASKYFHEGQGHCNQGHIYASSAWELASASGGQKGFDTPEYVSWVDNAWIRCHQKSLGQVKFVSVWTNAGYRCYTGANCSPNGATNTKSWRKTAVRRLMSRNHSMVQPSLSTVGDLVIV